MLYGDKWCFYGHACQLLKDRMTFMVRSSIAVQFMHKRFDAWMSKPNVMIVKGI